MNEQKYKSPIVESIKDLVVNTPKNIKELNRKFCRLNPLEKGIIAIAIPLLYLGTGFAIEAHKEREAEKAWEKVQQECRVIVQRRLDANIIGEDDIYWDFRSCTSAGGDY